METIRKGYGWVAAKFAGQGSELAVVPVRRGASALSRFSGVCLWLMLGIVLVGMSAHADLTNLVSSDGLTVSFTPGVVVTPIITGVIAAIGAGAALLIITVGIRWIYRTIKGSK